MPLPVSLELYAYWSALRAGRTAPERNAIEPGAIRGVLADTFILDFDAESGFPLRIVGSRAKALFLRELRGVSFLQLWRDADRQELTTILNCVADEALPFLLGAHARAPGLAPLDLEFALLPLFHNGQARSRMLGCVGVRDAPDWLGLIGVGPATLTSLGALESAIPLLTGRLSKARSVGSFERQ